MLAESHYLVSSNSFKLAYSIFVDNKIILLIDFWWMGDALRENEFIACTNRLLTLGASTLRLVLNCCTSSLSSKCLHRLRDPLANSRNQGRYLGYRGVLSSMTIVYVPTSPVSNNCGK